MMYNARIMGTNFCKEILLYNNKPILHETFTFIQNYTVL